MTFESKKNKLLQTFENEIKKIQTEMVQETTALAEKLVEQAIKEGQIEKTIEVPDEQMKKLVRQEVGLFGDKIKEFQDLEIELITEELSKIKPGITKEQYLDKFLHFLFQGRNLKEIMERLGCDFRMGDIM